MTRYPIAALAALLGLTENAALNKLGASGTTAQQYRRDGVSALVADRLAVKAGFHPGEVWPSWIDDQLAACTTPCDRCGEGYVPRRKDQRFCSTRCKDAWHAAAKYRRRYDRDPAFRAAEIERCRSKYRESHDYAIAAQRRRDAAKREQRAA